MVVSTAFGQYLRARRELLRPEDVGLPSLGRHMDVLTANRLASALSPSFSPGVNLVRAAFLGSELRTLFRDWENVARSIVAGLRALVGPDVDDPRLAQLVGELSVRSDQFRRLWARHDVHAAAIRSAPSTIQPWGRSSCGYILGFVALEIPGPAPTRRPATSSSAASGASSPPCHQASSPTPSLSPHSWLGSPPTTSSGPASASSSPASALSAPRQLALAYGALDADTGVDDLARVDRGHASTSGGHRR
jgi:MmyB-like transcription regulator ligand binding domain